MTRARHAWWRWAACGVALGLLVAGCGGRAVARLQARHGQEFSCDRRYVQVERVDEERWVSRGCAFEADWRCAGGECALVDARAWNIGAP